MFILIVTGLKYHHTYNNGKQDVVRLHVCNVLGSVRVSYNGSTGLYLSTDPNNPNIISNYVITDTEVKTTQHDSKTPHRRVLITPNNGTLKLVKERFLVTFLFELLCLAQKEVIIWNCNN